MPGNSNADPSFFKVLIAVDFKMILRFPPAFSKKHEVNPGEKTKLRAHSGAMTWKVKVEKMEYGRLCFTKGWQNFAEDAALQLGELVFFTRVAPSEFDVAVYRTNFCERQIPQDSHASFNNLHAPKAKNVGKRPKPPGNDDVSPGESSSSSPLYFEFRLKYYHRSRVNLPKGFAVAGKLEGESHVRMEFVGRERGEGERVVLLDTRPHIKRVDLANGWSKFLTENSLVFDKIYSFELTTRGGINVILVKECQMSRDFI